MSLKEYRVIKPFDSRKGVLTVGKKITFPNEKIAQHHLKYGYVEPAAFPEPKRKQLPVKENSQDFKVSEVKDKMEGISINEARDFAGEDTRATVKKHLADFVKKHSEKNLG